MRTGLKINEVGNPFHMHEGERSWTHVQGDKYRATGTDCK